MPFIAGPAGKLEISLQEPENPKKIIGIICHPNPLHGGTMDNKVVTTIANVFRDLNIINIRFNYRGVGQSEGNYGETIGEIADTLAVIQWAKQQWPDYEIFLAGFSFGAYISLCVANQTPIKQLITIAPTVNWHDYTNLSFDGSWIVLVAEKDEVVPANQIYAWIKTLKHKPVILSFPEAGHFFNGQLVNLREQLTEKLR